ncbi:uncharacterized protein JCM6883_001009 [Sporobolomyces salmoneus]|uniref:uncharacterized protein n=1 Tax=Sporobolomyces salmoneus TaxID=183962 RepID=UPI003172A065
MSGISPYHDAPNADSRPPPSCKVAAAATLLRHSSIYANDDEFEDYMQPFIERVEKFQKEKKKIEKKSPLSFLNDWVSPITEDNLEDITEPGKADAREFGRRLRKTYGHLLPPKHLGKKATKNKKEKKVPPFKVWSASSSRDVTTSQELIKGAFPYWQGGDEGNGDSTVVELVKVPNNSTEWANSLTPHKICPAFTKEVGKPEAQEWLEHYGPPILERMQSQAPGLELELNDVIAMAMLCGYETVISKQRKSNFCSPDIFTPDDFRAFGYWNDIKYHYIVGYASPVAPFLGVGWLNTSTHNLLSIYDNSHDHPSTSLSKKKKPNLPGPSLPPDATHSQLFFTYITHREEPPLAAVALGIWNTTSLPTDHIEKGREWQTSHLLPFLGHITIERLACEVAEFSEDGGDDEGETEDYIRIVINGAPQPLPYCQDGPGRSCGMEEFAQHVKDRAELYKDQEGACKKEDDE